MACRQVATFNPDDCILVFQDSEGIILAALVGRDTSITQYTNGSVHLKDGKSGILLSQNDLDNLGLTVFDLIAQVRLCQAVQLTEEAPVNPEPFSFDIADTVITKANLNSLVGGNVFYLTIVPKGDGVTISIDGSPNSAIEAGRIKTIGLQTDFTLTSDFTINNPNGIEINITGDFI